ncbi:hypothetical protein FEDK69T_08110 [Flavobacterium enshiense DK69]|uniref:Uncharacterized protein n=1 Tax=Flavobacterium enshiense DK69 TaxID=1107311 RepID=V6SD24_9FLAO|nr:hypothetical protein [Flavobacterium enshiense]ESU24364.1 hypothetical protein FEDK69T_08110 [Flavobacterium enshiense DK69]KGO94469.1 hypothetical protein Q767_12935 [Flavobacterium enshiense DK69]
MVRIVNYQKRQSEGGKEFFVLELQGGIEMVKSQTTDRCYLTVRKATILSTFDELTCKALIGTELPGRVEKVNCEPYEYTINETGEVISLQHRYEYFDDSVVTSQTTEKGTNAIESFMSEEQGAKSFSTNGEMTH